MEKFSIEAAKAGAEIYTNKGHKVRILTYDRVSDGFPIVALIMDDDGIEKTECFDKNGVTFNNPFHPLSLRIGKPEPTKKVGYVNLHKESNGTVVAHPTVHANLEDAAQDCGRVSFARYFATVKIEWEEDV